MATDTFTCVDAFAASPFNKIHDLANDSLKFELCTNANAPTAADSVLADLTPIAYTNLLPADRLFTTTSSTQTSGLYKLIIADLVLTASGGAVATFRHIAIYNVTATNDDLLGWLDYGSDLTLAEDDTLTIDMSAATGLLQATLTP